MIYISIMLLVAILVASRFPIVKGIIGETIIRIVIGRNTVNQKQQKYVINNLVLEITPGKTSQVDHVVINQTESDPCICNSGNPKARCPNLYGCRIC